MMFYYYYHALAFSSFWNVCNETVLSSVMSQCNLNTIEIFCNE